MGWACPRGLWSFTLMRRKEHAWDCNHFYIILGHHYIIRKGWFPWPQQGLKLQALPQPGFRKVTEIALASFCSCVLLRYKVSVRWQSSHRDTLQPIHQNSDSQLSCGASCFQNQLPKLQLYLNLFSMQYGWNLNQLRPALTAASEHLAGSFAVYPIYHALFNNGFSLCNSLSCPLSNNPNSVMSLLVTRLRKEHFRSLFHHQSNWYLPLSVTAINSLFQLFMLLAVLLADSAQTRSSETCGSFGVSLWCCLHS